MNNLKKFVIMLILVILALIIIGFLMRLLGTNNFIDLIFVSNLIIYVYFMISNGIKKEDFNWHNIKNGELQNGGVALIWFIIFSVVWGILLYIRINEVSMIIKI